MKAVDRFVAGEDGLAAVLRAMPFFEPPGALAAWMFDAARTVDAERRAVRENALAACAFEPPESLREAVLQEARVLERAQEIRREGIRSILARGGSAEEALGAPVTAQTETWLRQTWMQRLPRQREMTPQPVPRRACRWWKSGLALSFSVVLLASLAVQQYWFDVPREDALPPVPPERIAMAEPPPPSPPASVFAPEPVPAPSAVAEIPPPSVRPSPAPPAPARIAVRKSEPAAHSDRLSAAPATRPERRLADGVGQKESPAMASAPPASLEAERSPVPAPELPEPAEAQMETVRPAAVAAATPLPAVESHAMAERVAPEQAAELSSGVPAPELPEPAEAQMETVHPAAVAAATPLPAVEPHAMAEEHAAPAQTGHFYPIDGNQWKRLAASLTENKRAHAAGGRWASADVSSFARAAPARQWQLSARNPETEEVRALADLLRAALPSGEQLNIQADPGIPPGFARLAPPGR